MECYKFLAREITSKDSLSSNGHMVLIAVGVTTVTHEAERMMESGVSQFEAEILSKLELYEANLVNFEAIDHSLKRNEMLEPDSFLDCDDSSHDYVCLELRAKEITREGLIQMMDELYVSLEPDILESEQRGEPISALYRAKLYALTTRLSELTTQ